MKDKLVSVIIPVYNVKDYLEECVQSVLNQTYDNLEIILVDDGSTDGSATICDSFIALDKRIRVIHKDNTGLGLSRNVGIENANGEYICFIDSDDFISSCMIEELMNNIVKFKFDTVIGGYTRVDENGRKLYSKKYNSTYYKVPEIKLKLLPRLIGSSPCKRDSIKMSVWNVMFSMKIIKEYNIRFVSERQYISEDIIWDMDYFSKASKVKVLSSDSYFYRIRNNSLTKEFNYKQRLPDIKKLYLFEESKLSNLGILEISKERLAREYFINLAACISRIVRTNNLTKSRKIILEIMDDNFIQRLISNYPYKNTNLKSKLFLYLILKKEVLLIIMLFRIFNA